MGPPPSGLPTRLVLSDGERASYRRLADTLLKTALREYAAFCMDNPARRVSSLDWKLVKSQDSVSVYKARHPPTARKDAPFEQRLLTPEGRYERVDTNISVPTMLVTGTMRGTVDDAVHGAFVDGPESHATRGYYIHDRSTDFRVLARIDEPTESDPHRFCGIAWTEMGGAGVPFVKRRDLLTLVASGMATVPGTSGGQGDRIGYYILHSISHPQVRAFSEHKLLRAKCSFSYLFSQQHPHGVAGGSVGSHVETFQKGFFAPLGDVPERGVVSAVVRTLICPSRLVDAGYNRKLSFLLQHAPPTRAPRQKKHPEHGNGTNDHGDTTDDDDEDNCAGGCAKRRSDSFFSSSGGSPFSRSGGPLLRFTAKPQHHESHGVCVVCKLPVCGACKVTKKLVVDATGYELVVKSLGFCLVCVNKAKTLDAPMLARQELLENRRGFAPSPQPAHRPASAGARMSPDPASSSSSVRSPPTSNRSVCSPLMDKPRVPRKTWVDASPSSSYSSDDGYATRVRAASEMPRVERKTSWLGGEVSSSSTNNNSTHSEASRYDRKNSRGGTLSIDSLRTTNTGSVAAQTAFDHKSSPLADEQVASSSGTFAKTLRTPSPPVPSRRASHAPTSLASSTIGETAAVAMPLPVGAPELSAQRSRAPQRPRHQSWQPSSTVNPSGQVRPTHAATVGAPEFIAQRVRAPPPQRPRHQSWQSTDSARMERAGTSPYISTNTGSSGIQTSTPLQPTQDKQRQTYTATQPRRRIDERAAIEDITMRGILL